MKRTHYSIASINLLTPVLFVTALFNVAASFNVQELPIQHPEAKTFIAHADDDAIADIFILDGRTLIIHYGASPGVPSSAILAKGTSALDICDIDGDGRREIISIAGRKVLRQAIPAPGRAAAPPAILFECETLLAGPVVAPHPYVLAVPYEGRTLLALPCFNRLELRSLDGELVAEFPILQQARAADSLSTPFSAWAINPPQAGPSGALEFRVSTFADAAPELPEALRPPLDPRLTYRLGTARHVREAAAQAPETWPWFPLRTDGTPRERVLYALARPDYADTLILIRSPDARNLPERRNAYAYTSKRRYPGILLLPRDVLPDFNGDGYADLLLWKAPLPGTSLDSLSRAAYGGTWPLQLSVHLYSPEDGLFRPGPQGHLRQRVPITWFMAREFGAPIRNPTLRDFDGDGGTDLAFSPRPKEFALWLYRDGFAKEPDYVASFPGRILDVELMADLEGNGKTTILLRSEKAFYALRLP